MNLGKHVFFQVAELLISVRDLFYLVLKIFHVLQVIPPGMEFHHIVPHEDDMDGETEESDEHPTSPDPPIWAEVSTMLRSYCI